MLTPYEELERIATPAVRCEAVEDSKDNWYLEVYGLYKGVIDPCIFVQIGDRDAAHAIKYIFNEEGHGKFWAMYSHSNAYQLVYSRHKCEFESILENLPYERAEELETELNDLLERYREAKKETN